MSDDFVFPEYPALCRCVLIDARHASRSVLLKDIASTALFERIAEGTSLQNGLYMIENQEADACFIGPSISPRKAAEFLVRAKQRMLSKDCALIAIMNREEDSAVAEQVLLTSGAHSLVKRPCSRMALADGIVRAVVLANSGSAWAGIFYGSGHQNAVVDASAVLTMQPLTLPEQEAVTVPTTELERTVVSVIPSASFVHLKGILGGIESGVFRLDPQGHPTPATRSEVLRVCEEILPLPEKEEGENGVRFRKLFKEALLQWVVDLILTDEEAATEKLKASLLAAGG